MKTINLNDSEISVLWACRSAIADFTNCEFGLVDEISANGINKNQLKGYLSQLQSKGLIEIHYMDNSNGGNQFVLTHKGCDILLGLTTDEKIIENLNDIKVNI